MEQHPVPQNISSYEFRLVGDMTLKQFFQLAGGCVLGIIFYQLPIAGIFKYPLTLISVLIGVLSAFVPFQGRPFNQWLAAFFRAIYSPTEYVWIATPLKTEAPLSTADVPTAATISTTRPQSQVVTGFMSFFSSLLSPKSPKTVAAPPVPKPISPPTPTSGPSPTPVPVTVTITEKSLPPVIKPQAPTITTFSVVPPVPKPIPPPTPPPPSPVPPPVLTPTPAPNTFTVTDKPTPIKSSDPFPGLAKIAPPSATPPPATVATAATPITPPTNINVLAGLVADSQNMAISGATVEIIDSHTGIPARALRTNRLGQFQIAIPLPPGSYIINTEKPEYVFEPVSVQVQNAIIQPIIITSKNV